MKSCGPDSPNEEEGADAIDPETGLDPLVEKEGERLSRARGDDYEDDPDAMDGRRRGGTMGMDSIARGGARAPRSLAKAEANSIG